MGPIDAGELYLVMMRSRPVGTVIFQLHDKTYWPDMRGKSSAHSTSQRGSPVTASGRWEGIL
jgi:hypothetical protein